MRKVEEYLEHAEQCREMARKAQPEHRQQLLQMAQTWAELAETRRKQLEREAAQKE